MQIGNLDLSLLSKHFNNLLNKLKNIPAITLDGAAITLHGNIDRPEDIRILKKYDDTGVGLYRTEMMFLEKNSFPNEETQFKTYKRALFRLKGQLLTIRTRAGSDSACIFSIT